MEPEPEWDPELAIVAGRVDVLLSGVRAAASIAAKRFALDALARGLLLADPGSVTPRQQSEARALRIDASTVEAAGAGRLPHAVAVPLVARAPAGGAPLGFVRQVHVTYDPVGLMAGDGLLEADARRAIGDAIEHAAARARPPSPPGLHCLVAAQPRALSRARVEGRSLGAAAFVSAMSLWTERPVRPDVVVTGAVQSGGAVVSVGSIEPKVSAARRHGARALVVPLADAPAARQVGGDGGPDVIGVADLDALIEATLTAACARPIRPDRAMAEARALFAAGWQGYRWVQVRERLSRLSGRLPAGRADLRTELLVRLAAAQRHLGDPVGSLELLDEAVALVGSELGRVAVPDGPITYLWLQTAMTHRQLCRFEEAAEAAARAARVARRARLRGQLIKALGCVGLVDMSRGRCEAAVEAFAESLQLVLEHDPHDTARTRAYLIEAHAAAGHAERAERQHEAAMREVEASTDPTDRLSRQSWVTTSWAGALLRLGRPREAVEAIEGSSAAVASLLEEPLPGLLARRHLGVGLCAIGREEGYEILAASPLAHGRALEPHLRFLAHLNVLYEARARLRAGDWGPDIAGRAARALDHVPRYGAVERFLGPPLARTRALLARSAPTEDADALDALLERCARLG